MKDQDKEGKRYLLCRECLSSKIKEEGFDPDKNAYETESFVNICKFFQIRNLYDTLKRKANLEWKWHNPFTKSKRICKSCPVKVQHDILRKK